MPEPLANLYSDFDDGFGEIHAILYSHHSGERGLLRVRQRITVAEMAIFLEELLSSAGLSQDESPYAQTWLEEACHILGRELESGIIHWFYYFRKHYLQDPRTATDQALSLTIAIRALETCGHGVRRGTTPWRIIEHDIPKMCSALGKAIESRGSEPAANELFLVLNLIELLSCIDDSEPLRVQLDALRHLIERSRDAFLEGYVTAPGLAAYADELRRRLGLNIPEVEGQLATRGKAAAFVALDRVREGKQAPPNLLQEARESGGKHLWWIATAWGRRNAGDATVGILPFFRPWDVNAAFTVVWGDPAELSNVGISESELNWLMALTAKEIKGLLHTYFLTHPAITPSSRANLDFEREKPDAGGEISDFNVEFTVAERTFWAAIPIKSGREVGTRNAGRVSVEYVHQWIAPALAFGSERAVVFPILLTRPTLDAGEFISQLRARLDLPIAPVGTETFLKILKTHGLTPGPSHESNPE